MLTIKSKEVLTIKSFYKMKMARLPPCQENPRKVEYPRWNPWLSMIIHD